jgi:hypothetical protein
MQLCSGLQRRILWCKCWLHRAMQAIRSGPTSMAVFLMHTVECQARAAVRPVDIHPPSAVAAASQCAICGTWDARSPSCTRMRNTVCVGFQLLL